MPTVFHRDEANVNEEDTHQWDSNTDLPFQMGKLFFPFPFCLFLLSFFIIFFLYFIYQHFFSDSFHHDTELSIFLLFLLFFVLPHQPIKLKKLIAIEYCEAKVQTKSYFLMACRILFLFHFI